MTGVLACGHEGPCLALYTFGVFRVPAEDPANEGFHALNDPIFEGIADTPGLIAHAGYDDLPGWPQGFAWDPGAQVWPRFYVERGDGWSPATLSLWTGPEAALGFAHSGLHARAYAQRAKWFDDGGWPGHAAWWADPADPPGWAEAVARFEHLADTGPSARAFSLHAPLPPPSTKGAGAVSPRT